MIFAIIVSKLDIISIVDGAHALGSIDLRFDYEDDYLPDVYLTNCHKWFCAPKGVGLLYVKSNNKTQNSSMCTITTESILECIQNFFGQV